MPTRVERWRTPDDDELELRRLDAPPDAPPTVPRLVMLHGLEGTIGSHYLGGMLALARDRGWAADVLIFRGCNGELNSARRLYHSGETTDLDFVVRTLVEARPEQPLLLAGFSLGGNVLLKWLGEQGGALPRAVRAAASMSVPYDLARGARNLERGFSRVYARHFLRTLRLKATRKLEQHPGLFDRTALARARTIHEFDHAVTAPVHGFASALDYYTQSSAIRFLHGVRRPTLLLSAYDDPFLPGAVLNDVARLARTNSCLTVEFHQRGGHVGFVSGRMPGHARSYGEERMIEFLSARCEA